MDAKLLRNLRSCSPGCVSTPNFDNFGLCEFGVPVVFPTNKPLRVEPRTIAVASSCPFRMKSKT